MCSVLRDDGRSAGNRLLSDERERTALIPSASFDHRFGLHESKNDFDAEQFVAQQDRVKSFKSRGDMARSGAEAKKRQSCQGQKVCSSQLHGGSPLITKVRWSGLAVKSGHND
jgi:hypothetical protein